MKNYDRYTRKYYNKKCLHLFVIFHLAVEYNDSIIHRASIFPPKTRDRRFGVLDSLKMRKKQNF